MIGLHHRNEDERNRALASVGRRCQSLGAPLVFFGRPAACQSVREWMQRLDPRAAESVRFCPLASGPAGDAATSKEAVAAAVAREWSAASGPFIAWADTPPAALGLLLSDALRARREAEGGLGPAVIQAFSRDDPGALSLLESAQIVVSAAVVIPRCPAWVVVPRLAHQDDLAGSALLRAPEADLAATEVARSEHLVALGQLAAVVAHELGNPLSIISSSLQYLHERLVAAGDPGGDFTLTALHNVDRMHGLLHSMLDFAAVEKPQLQEIDVNRTIFEVVRFTSAECARRRIQVALTLAPTLPPVSADPAGITQICLNVFKNAFDALAVSGARLTVRSRTSPERDHVFVEIENDGPAIPEEAMTRIFRPFNTTKPCGTGLGLHISRQIARDHGGDLAAQNVPGAVRLTLTLPASRHE